MKTKQVYTLGVILAVLFAGVLIRQFQKPPELATEEFSPLDLSLDAEKVQKIDISKPKDQKDEEYARLMKGPKGWVVESSWNARADQRKLEEFLKAIREAKGELRGKGKGLYADFGIGDDQAYKIILADSSGKSLLTLFVGNKKAGASSLFVRKSDSERIYLTEANLLSQMGIYGDPAKESLSSDFWAATEIAQFETDKVKQLEVKRKSGAKENLAASVKKDGSWKLTRPGLPFSAEDSKVTQFLDGIKSWRAQKVVDPKGDYGFDKSQWQMTLALESGEPITITAGRAEKEQNAVYIKVSSEPAVFLLSGYYYENLNADDSRFFAENPLGVDPDKTEKLVIHADKKELSFKPKEKKGDSLTAYLNELKNFHVDKLIDGGQAKGLAKPRYWIEIQKEGSPSQFLEAGEIISPESKEYGARMRAAPRQPFSLSESRFKTLFENLDRLKEPSGNPASA